MNGTLLKHEKSNSWSWQNEQTDLRNWGQSSNVQTKRYGLFDWIPKRICKEQRLY